MKRRSRRPPAPRRAAGRLGAHAAAVGAMTLLSRVSGFARDVALSHFLGAGLVADAFLVAVRVPRFFRRAFAAGAVSQAIVPVFAERRAAGDGAADRLVRAVTGALLVVLLPAAAAGSLAAPWLAAGFAPGFAADGRLALAADLLAVTFPCAAFLCLAAYAAALLNAHERFALPAFAPVLPNAVLVGTAVAAAGLPEGPAAALAWGLVAGTAAQLAVQLPAARSLGLLRAPRIDRRDPGLRRVGRLLPPAALAGSVGEVNGVVGSVLASLLGPGAISWLYYAGRLARLPVGLVGAAIATVLLPNLARLHAAGERAAYAATLDWGLRLCALLALPVAAGLLVLAGPLVTVAFRHGAFAAADAEMAAAALRALALGVPAQVAAAVAAPGLFARQDARAPLRCAALAVAVNGAAALVLFGPLGHVGIALAASGAAVAQAALLLRALARSGAWSATPALGRAVVAATAGSAAMAAGLAWLTPPAKVWLDAGVPAGAAMLALAVAGGAALYAAAVLALGVRPAQLRLRA